MEPIAIAGIILAIFITGCILYNIACILLFFFLWKLEQVQNLLKRDKQYGNSIISFITWRNRIFWSTTFYSKISLYDNFLLLTEINKKIKVEKSPNVIYFTDDVPWWDYFGLKIYKLKMLRVKYNKQNYDYYFTNEQADIIKSWIASG